MIERVCDEVISGALDEDFPLYVFQTGSGTQSNMNVNEVISNRCIQLVGGTLGSQEPIHPNDHVNMGQSSNDTFPTAMHIAAYTMATQKTIPALKRLRDATERNAKRWADVVKIGRTHLEDAVPLTVGQEWSGYTGALDDAIAEAEHATHGLLKVAMGGTAVGTGLNAPAGFGEEVAAEIASMTGVPFETAANKFTAQARWTGWCAPMAGCGPLPSPCSRSPMTCAGWVRSAHRDPRADLPVERTRLLDHARQGQPDPGRGDADGRHRSNRLRRGGEHGRRRGQLRAQCLPPDPDQQLPALGADHGRHVDHFREFMVEGTKLNEAKLKENIERSVMMVTALSPVIGYDKAAAISYYAIDHNLTLKAAALANGVSEDLFDRVVVPIALTHPGSADLPSDSGKA